jgi:LmbE family N-acetylglucosaminyl deacetylase/CheY-like chemotaxis protein
MTAHPAEPPVHSTRAAPRDAGGTAADADASEEGPHRPVAAGSGTRIVVVDADETSSRTLEQLLVGTGAERVLVFQEPVVGLGYLATIGADLLVVDLDMLGMAGIDLVERARVLLPNLGVIVLATAPSVDIAVGALRARVDDLLIKPLISENLLARVSVVTARASTVPHERILAVGAHPDDVEIGAGGTLLAHRASGDSVTILTLSGGSRGGNAAIRRRESEEAAAILRARLIIEDLEDTGIREGDPTTSIIERVVSDIRPTIVYTHSVNDIHQDHRNTHSATMVAARGVPYVLCFQSPSSTIAFRPSRFVSVEHTLDRKMDAIAAFASQASTREYLDDSLLRASARYWARFGGGTAVEPFEVVRDRRRSERVSHVSSQHASAGAMAGHALDG